MLKVRPQEIKCQENWNSKEQGVIFVSNYDDIDILHKLLVDQDSCWKEYKHLIRVTPGTVSGIEEMKFACNY